MYSSIIRSDEYKHDLLTFIRHHYAIDVTRITPAKRGFYGETWKVSSLTSDYFIKLIYAPDYQANYERGLYLVQHFSHVGIHFAGRIVKTIANSLYTQFDGAVLAVFEWIEGENVQNEITKIEEYKLLAKVYTLSPIDIEIESEDFSSNEADEFFKKWSGLEDQKMLSLLEKNRLKIEHRAARLSVFSKLCCMDKSDFFITHGDAGGNFIVSGGSNFIVDWDSAKLAPPERDAWFCVHWDWAMTGFREALTDNRIYYKLRTERFAYYCYWFFFYYLNTYLDAKTEAEIVEEYFDSWMSDNVKWADKIDELL